MKNFSKDIKRLIFAQATSLLGGNILNFALSLFVLQLTGSVGTFSAILAAVAIPSALLAPIGGVIADRLDKKKMIVFLDFCKGVLAFTILVVLLLGISPVAWITGVMLLMSVSMTFYTPITLASVPALVEEESLTAANGIVQGLDAVSGFIAPVIAGFLILMIPIELIVALGMILFWGSALMELWIKIPFQKLETKTSVLKTVGSDLKEGFTYLSKDNLDLLKLAFSIAIFVAVIMPLFVVGVPYITQMVFGLNQFHVGVAQGTIAIAMLLGGLSAQVLKKWLTMKTISIWFGGGGCAVLILALALNFTGLIGLAIFTLGFMVIQFLITCINVFIISSIQAESPSHLIGKVIGIVVAIAGLLTPVGLRGIGILFNHFEGNLIPLFLLISVVLILGAGLTKVLLREKKVQAKNSEEVVPLA